MYSVGNHIRFAANVKKKKVTFSLNVTFSDG